MRFLRGWANVRERERGQRSPRPGRFSAQCKAAAYTLYEACFTRGPEPSGWLSVSSSKCMPFFGLFVFFGGGVGVSYFLSLNWLSSWNGPPKLNLVTLLSFANECAESERLHFHQQTLPLMSRYTKREHFSVLPK